MASILDSLFSPSGNGLLAFLQNNAMNQQFPASPDAAQYGPTPALPQFAQQAQQPVPQNPPQVIQAPQAAPQRAPQAAPQMPPQMPPQAPQLPPAISHPLSSLGNFFTGITPQGQAMQQQSQIANVTARALIARGVDPQTAIAAVQPGNGDLLKELFTQASSRGRYTQETDKDGNVWNVDTQTGEKKIEYQPKDDKFNAVKIGQDAMGREQYGALNQKTGDITPIKAPNSDTGALGSGIPGDPTKTGDDYIASLPQQYQGVVKGFVDGTAPMPRITTKNQQAMQLYFDMAKQADPSFDATKYGARQSGMKDFSGGGKSAEMVRSANQTIGHVGDLVEKAAALHNSSFTPWNYAANSISSMFGNDAAGNWVTNAHAVADEIGKLFKGNNLSDTEIKQWAENLTPNMSPQQQRGSIKNLMGLLQHSVDALEDKRTASIGPQASAKMGPLITPKSQQILDRVMQWANGEHPAASGPVEAPKLGVGESTNVNGISIKKVSE